MNSDKLGQNERRMLREKPPAGYRIESPLPPRFWVGKDPKLQWRQGSPFESDDKPDLAAHLGVSVFDLGDGIYGGEWVLKSPSGTRVLLDNKYGRCVLFEVRDGKPNLETRRRIYGVNFDDPRRWFINWQAFLDDSTVVGTLMDDDEIDELPSRNLLYLYNIDTMTLQRITLPTSPNWNRLGGHSIEGVSSNAILLRIDGFENDVTIYVR